jgi:hypothetical protein
MKRTHVIAISLMLGAAVLVGGIAATRTAHLGATAQPRPTITNAAIARRMRRLDRVEAALRRALARKPPAVTAAAAAPQRAQRVVYVRPAPVVHVVHRHGGDGGGGESEGGGDD